MNRTIDLGYLELIGFGSFTMITAYLFNNWWIPLGTFIAFIVFGVVKIIKDNHKDKREKEQEKHEWERKEHEFRMKQLMRSENTQQKLDNGKLNP